MHLQRCAPGVAKRALRTASALHRACDRMHVEWCARKVQCGWERVCGVARVQVERGLRVGSRLRATACSSSSASSAEMSVRRRVAGAVHAVLTEVIGGTSI